MMKPNDVYKRVEDRWVSRFILDEVVIMPLCRSEEDMQYIYSISNETGSRIYELLDGEHSTKDIQEILKSEYQGHAEVVERETLGFISDLLEVKLIEKIEEKAEAKKPLTTYQKLNKKKLYTSPEIAKVKMQPEQAVLSCCTSSLLHKQSAGQNWCHTAACGAECEAGGLTFAPTALVT